MIGGRAFLRPAAALAAILAGLFVHGARAGVWTSALVLLGGITVAQTVRDVFRGRFASDIVAALAIIGAVVFGEPLAGLIVVLMQTGGEALDRWAEGRASAAVRALEDSAPRIAHRVTARGTEDITVDLIVPGDRCLVRPGEMVPADGVIIEGDGELDLSRITGEPLPVRVTPGAEVRSGAVVSERPLVVRATSPASASLYARIVELVREAQAHKAPLQRLADRWAVWFTPLTIIACAATYAATHDTTRLLAVLVVATPCPLILAAPVAIIGGINRVTRHRVVVRTGAALERLATIDTIALDKTGTLTVGHPELRDIRPATGAARDDVLALGASLEHASGHPMAQAVVRAAAARGLALEPASEVHETPGRGVRGMVRGRRITVGSEAWTRECAPGGAPPIDPDLAAAADETVSVITIDGAYGGLLVFADTLRPGLSNFFNDLGALGIRRTLLLSGDRADRVAHVARELGIAEARGELLPDEKVSAIKGLVASGARVAMVGDGVNDAPALAAATVGVAIAAHGGGIAAESADCVLLSGDLTLLARVIRVSRRTLAIARQSIYAGVGLSMIAMGFAAAGLLQPVAGALVQEAIDVAVILNALRATIDD
ncbi:MAG TPA: heavy metal translocating P-type ATPase [Gemmatimonadaceae bacterium]|nr:heavy metal translocating P-type ATPase [Gemmatimonadaceae bacterium]